MELTANEYLIEIQVPFHSAPIKYHYDKSNQALFVERFLNTSMHYPCHVASIKQAPSAQYQDLEALLLSPSLLVAGCCLKAKAIGILALSNGKSDYNKVLMLPTDDLTDAYHHVNTYADLHPLFLEQIAHFFTHYEDLNDNSEVEFKGWFDMNFMPQPLKATA